MKQITAYCSRSGIIKFGKTVEPGHLKIETGPEKELKQAVLVIARQSYPSKPGGKDSVPLVPGIPEAPNETVALRCLSGFIVQVRIRINPLMRAVEASRRKDIQFPDPIVIGVFKNDLQGTISIAREYGLTVDQIDQALRHVHTHIPTNEINRLLRKWGAK